MPHLTVEYTDNLRQFNAAECLVRLNQALLSSGQFEENDIKSRAIALSDFQIGVKTRQQAFVHVTLALLDGRSLDVRQQLSNLLLDELARLPRLDATLAIQLCVEVKEIERASYAKLAYRPD